MCFCLVWSWQARLSAATPVVQCCVIFGPPLVSDFTRNASACLVVAVGRVEGILRRLGALLCWYGLISVGAAWSLGVVLLGVSRRRAAASWPLSGFAFVVRVCLVYATFCIVCVLMYLNFASLGLFVRRLVAACFRRFGFVSTLASAFLVGFGVQRLNLCRVLLLVFVCWLGGIRMLDSLF